VSVWRGTAIDLGRFLTVNEPLQRAHHKLEICQPTLEDLLMPDTRRNAPGTAGTSVARPTYPVLIRPSLRHCPRDCCRGRSLQPGEARHFPDLCGVDRPIPGLRHRVCFRVNDVQGGNYARRQGGKCGIEVTRTLRLDYWEEVEKALGRIRAPDPQVRLEWRLEVGDAAARILEAEQAITCDLIVMGTHSRTELGRMLLGSVAEQVVRLAPCPVLKVKTPFPQATPAAEHAAEGIETASGAT
jgi:hypothetical protein